MIHFGVCQVLTILFVSDYVKAIIGCYVQTRIKLDHDLQANNLFVSWWRPDLMKTLLPLFSRPTHRPRLTTMGEISWPNSTEISWTRASVHWRGMPRLRDCTPSSWCDTLVLLAVIRGRDRTLTEELYSQTTLVPWSCLICLLWVLLVIDTRSGHWILG